MCSFRAQQFACSVFVLCICLCACRCLTFLCVSRWCAVDDYPLEGLKEHYICTNEDYGLTDCTVTKVVDYLNSEDI